MMTTNSSLDHDLVFRYRMNCVKFEAQTNKFLKLKFWDFLFRSSMVKSLEEEGRAISQEQTWLFSLLSKHNLLVSE